MLFPLRETGIYCMMKAENNSISERSLMMTSKQRAFLISLAMKEKAVLFIGKGGITPELTENVRLALEARELVKLGIQQNCLDDPRTLAETLAERTGSEVVQLIGRKIVLYKQGKDANRKIELPKAAQ